MPLYEYQCNTCSHRFEVIQKFSDPLASECPTCGGPVRKLLSSPAIRFKGSGWYVTDYARKGQTDSTAKDGSGEATPSSASGSTDASKDSGSAPSGDASKDSGSAPSSSAKTSTATGSSAK